MDKRDLSYVLSIQTDVNTTLTIELPFSVEFDIQRNMLTSANVAQIKIYNLSERNRNLIRKNRIDFDDVRRVELRAGYQLNRPVIFSGYISLAWSVRQGTDFITTIEAYDGGYAFQNSITSTPFPANTTKDTILRTLVGNLGSTVSIGAIGDYPGSITRGNAYFGVTTDILAELSGGGFFIDNGKAHILNEGEALQGELEEISAATGLLNTPVLQETILTFDMIFEPRLIIGQRVKLNSVTLKDLNAFYKVTAIKHRGMISEVISGETITSVQMIGGRVFEVLRG